MKKIITIALICVAATNAFSQDNWKIGVEFMPNLFWIYNKYDWDAETPTQGKDPLFFSPNGFHAGLSVKRELNEHFEVGVGLLYAYGKQKYFEKDNPTGSIKLGGVILEDDYYTELKHLKLPLYITGFLLEEGSTPYLQIGIAPTYLVGVTDFAGQTDVEISTGKDLYYNKYKMTEEGFTGIVRDYPQSEVITTIYKKQTTYSTFGLDALLGLGYKIKVNENIDIRVQATGSISLINPETHRGGFMRTVVDIYNRPPSYLINSGLSISTNYIF
jgi:hypothetical protein